MFISELPVSKEVKAIYLEARDISMQAQKQFMSSHLLLSIFTIECNARTILESRKISVDEILSVFPSLPVEPPETVDLIFRKATEIAQRLGAQQVNSLHLLMAIARLPSSTAAQSLDILGLPPHKLRNIVISALHIIPSKVKHKKESVKEDFIEALSEDSSVIEDIEDSIKGFSEEIIEVQKSRIEEYEAEETYFEKKRAITEDSFLTPPSKYALDPEMYPFLSSIGINLTLMAEEGKLHPLIGREKEIEQLIDILNKLKANNPCLIGESGVGKTAIIEGLAQKIVFEEEKYPSIAGKIIISISPSDLLKGTHMRGSLAERISKLKEEIKKSEGKIILFIDEIHNLTSQDVGNGKSEIVNDIKSSLAKGELPCIGATTTKEYQTYIQNDPSLERRFQPILVKESTIEETINTIKMLILTYSKHHNVEYEKEAINDAVRLSGRYITDRCFPDKAINVIDFAGSKAQRENKRVVTVQDIAEVVSALSNVPMEKLILKDSERILGMEKFLSSHIVGHEENLKKICKVIRRNFAGFSTNKPMGSFLFIGPTGVGKTETVRVIADFLFQSREAVVRLNMSEYSEPHSVASLIGAPPGYVGFEEGGRLAASMFKKPFQIVLFDEIDKAHRNVMNLLLQILDEGEIYDKKGRRIDFRNSIIVMTSNYGCEILTTPSFGIGFSKNETPLSLQKAREEELLKQVQKFFTPELWARIEEKLIFYPLSPEHIKEVAKLLIKKSSDNLFKDKRIKYYVSDEVLDYLIKRGGYVRALGARPMRNIISEEIEDVIAREILEGEIKEGSSLYIKMKNDKPFVLKRRSRKKD